MKISARNAESFARNPDPDIFAFLVYGPASGLVGERALSLARTSGVDLEDPFSATTLREEDLAGSPGRLFDEASAIPLGGGIRVVRVQGASDNVAEAMSSVFERSLEKAFIVVEAGDLGPRSRVRRLFEGADRAAAVPCYLDDDVARENLIRETLGGYGKEVEQSALAYLAPRLSGDRALSRRGAGQARSLRCWTWPDGAVTREMAADCIGDEAEHVLEDVAVAAAAGAPAELARAYDFFACVASGQQEIAVLRVRAGWRPGGRGWPVTSRDCTRCRWPATREKAWRKRCHR